MNKVSLKNQSSKLALTISVTGYEFPNSKDENDSNWLLVRTNLVSEGRVYQNTSPSLLTTDLTKIAIWFDNLARRRLPTRITMGFMEPNLEFQVFRSTDNFVRIGVTLDHESRPPFQLASWNENALCCFDLTYAELANTAAAFHRIAEQFPSKKSDYEITQNDQHFSGQVSRRFPETRH
jgi:hypothetical protein